MCILTCLYALLTLFSSPNENIYITTQLAPPIGIWSVKDNIEDDDVILLEIYEKDDKIEGRIIDIKIPNSDLLVCSNCPTPYVGKPLIGLPIIQSFKKIGHEWTSGKILNPGTGINADAEMWYENFNNPNILIVKSSHGLEVATQKWHKIE